MIFLYSRESLLAVDGLELTPELLPVVQERDGVLGRALQVDAVIGRPLGNRTFSGRRSAAAAAVVVVVDVSRVGKLDVGQQSLEIVEVVRQLSEQEIASTLLLRRHL